MPHRAGSDLLEKRFPQPLVGSPRISLDQPDKKGFGIVVQVGAPVYAVGSIGGSGQSIWAR